MLESKIEKTVCRYAEELGLLAEKFKTPNRRSVPDRLFSGPDGLHFYMEFKATGKAKTIHPEATGHEGSQYRDHQKRRKLGHRVYVIDDIEYGKRVINFEVTGNPAWLSKESGRLLPSSPTDL